MNEVLKSRFGIDLLDLSTVTEDRVNAALAELPALSSSEVVALREEHVARAQRRGREEQRKLRVQHLDESLAALQQQLQKEKKYRSRVQRWLRVAEVADQLTTTSRLDKAAALIAQVRAEKEEKAEGGEEEEDRVVRRIRQVVRDKRRWVLRECWARFAADPSDEEALASIEACGCVEEGEEPPLWHQLAAEQTELSGYADRVRSAFKGRRSVCKAFSSYCVPDLLHRVEPSVEAIDEFLSLTRKLLDPPTLQLVKDTRTRWVAEAPAREARRRQLLLLEAARRAVIDEQTCEAFCDLLKETTDDNHREAAVKLYVKLAMSRGPTVVPVLAAEHYCQMVAVSVPGRSDLALRAARCLWQREMDARRADLSPALDEKSIRRAHHQLGLLEKAWRGTLPDEECDAAVASLRRHIVDCIVRGVVDLPDIGVDELADLQRIVDAAAALHKEPPARLTKLSALLGDRFLLQEIMLNWNQGRLAEFSNAELRSLVCAMYEQSDARDAFASELK